MTTIDTQIRADWKLYCVAIGAGHTDVAKRVFDRVSALASAQIARKNTSRTLASVLGKCVATRNT